MISLKSKETLTSWNIEHKVKKCAIYFNDCKLRPGKIPGKILNSL
jgi:hypothetical protein